MASTSRILARNRLPKPSPLDAPRTSPAISMNSNWVGTVRAEPAMAESFRNRSSGTATRPVLGSMVQKGKFAASAADVDVSALNSVDYNIRQADNTAVESLEVYP